MISNLQQKLAAISKQSKNTVQAKQPKAELDLACSVFENTYNYSHMIGEIAIGELDGRNINSLLEVCFASSEDELTLSDIVFFDTETTGLGTGTSTAAFLIGTGYFENDSFVSKQFLMNDYYQESDMLSHLNDILANHKAVVSYNGKAYDNHVVNSRSILNRLPRLLDEKIHLDLLHSSRRLYKRRLTKCSMHSIEENVLNLHRIGDIPGSEIPEIFFNYIKYKDPALLDKVIQHNLQDIISMVGIALKLIDAYDNPLHLGSNDDIFSQGLVFEKLNFPQKAKLCYNILENYPPALLRLGYIAKAEMNYKEAISHFLDYSKIQRFDFTGDIELAKIYEHKIRDYDKALAHTKAALEKTDVFLSAASEDIINRLKQRKTRLIKKLSANRKE